ncbi:MULTISPECIES: hypothetical protein [Bacillus cereus group]|uniref:Uncharacterized protein n=2 Tax=Bacillus cereus group TaxID=86661 RepID=A0A2C1D6L4_BACCE|nr:MULTISPECIES: hypothetical protein [Bacillus cereus group]OFD75344.1 hypothetical protein BWGOE9_35880 [Bacillus mycoides]OFD75561.1 hypothetical protein BWGOE8_35220 [Bacillus mycoides]OFD77449.1 hypothetical protein BWGOE10_35470 [Bacillus mycoides]PGS95667.1 hypothetical protein COD09_22800 [Bacillus cereus]
MDFQDLMEFKGYIYLNKLFEPEENSLRVLIDRCKVNKTKGLAKITDEVEIEASSIDVDDNLPIVQLDFESYVAYSVTNESFTVMDNYEISEGRIFRVYSKLRYLDFVKAGTIAEFIFPEEQFVHYQIPCLNHIIDIISYDEPKITGIKRN